MSNSEIVKDELKPPEEIIETEKRRNKAVGYALFAAAAGLALLRIGFFFLSFLFENANMSELAAETLSDTLFSLLSQVVVCFLIPFLIYKFYQKRTVKQVFLDANYRKVKWWVVLASVPIGIGCYLVTLFTANYWISLLIGMGYTYSPGMGFYPEVFNPLLLLLSLVLTAVLPAICEEFLMRGNFVTSLRHNLKNFGVIVVASIAFGLFHQNIIQVFYTALFGGLAAYLVIKTGSVLPAIIMHFVNNALSVYLGYDSFYEWGIAGAMDKMLATPFVIYLFLLVGLGLIIGFTSLIVKQSKKEKAEELVLQLYKPSVRENAWHIGAIALTSAATLFTFIFGLVV